MLGMGCSTEMSLWQTLLKAFPESEPNMNTSFYLSIATTLGLSTEP